jgi:hypothetical protein
LPLYLAQAWRYKRLAAIKDMTYPCVGEVVLKPEKEDWRASITGDPSMLTIKYRQDKPSGATTMAITVAPHVTVFQATFPEDAPDRNLVVDFRKATVDNWARLYKWTDRAVTRVDDRRIPPVFWPLP